MQRQPPSTALRHPGRPSPAPRPVEADDPTTRSRAQHPNKMADEIQVLSTEESSSTSNSSSDSPVNPEPASPGNNESKHSVESRHSVVDSLTERGRRAKARAKAKVDAELREEMRAALRRQADEEKEVFIQEQIRELELQQNRMELEAKKAKLLAQARLQSIESDAALAKASIKDRQQQEHALIDEHVDRLVDIGEADVTEDQLFQAAEEVSMLKDATRTSNLRPASPTTSTPARAPRPSPRVYPLDPAVEVIELPPSPQRREVTPEARVIVVPPTTATATTTTTTTMTTAQPLITSILPTRPRKAAQPSSSRPAPPSDTRQLPSGDSTKIPPGHDYTQDWLNDSEPPATRARSPPPVATTSARARPMPRDEVDEIMSVVPCAPMKKKRRKERYVDMYFDRLSSVQTQPPIEVPKFSGKDPSKWKKFLSNFKEVIEKSTTDPGRRFVHLQGRLEGEAAKVIAPFDELPNAEAFQPAMAALKEKYESGKGLTEYWLLELTRGKFPGVGNYSDLLQKAYASFKNAGALDLVDRRSFIINIVERLPLDLQIEWAKKVPVIELETELTFKHLVDFVARGGLAFKDKLFGQVLRGRESQSAKPGQSSSRPAKRPRQEKTRHKPSRDSRKSANEQKTKSPPRKKAPSPVKVYATQEVSVECGLCTAPHETNKCPGLLKHNKTTRLNLVQYAGLCFVCLRPGHMATECRSKRTCDVEGCKGRHATILHGVEWPKKEQEPQGSSKGEGKGKGKGKGGKRVRFPPKGSRQGSDATVSKASVEGEQA